METRSRNEWQGASCWIPNPEAEGHEGTQHRKYCPKTASPACLKPQRVSSWVKEGILHLFHSKILELELVSQIAAHGALAPGAISWENPSLSLVPTIGGDSILSGFGLVGFVTQRGRKHPGFEPKIPNFEFLNSPRLNFTANSSPRPLAGDWPETNICFLYYFFCVHCFIPRRPTWIAQPELSGSE